MREIKFRAWLKETKEMVEVDDIRFSEPLMINTTSAWRLEDEIVLLQYTGLRDKNGREIYEGDIVVIKRVITRWKHEREILEALKRRNPKFVIVFEEGTFECKAKGEFAHSLSFLCKYCDIEVIGNIYEHKHLLEARK